MKYSLLRLLRGITSSVLCTPVSGCLLMACYFFSDFSVSFGSNQPYWPHQIIISLSQATKSKHRYQVGGYMMPPRTFGTFTIWYFLLRQKQMLCLECNLISKALSPLHLRKNWVCGEMLLITNTDTVMCSCVVPSHFISQISLFLFQLKKRTSCTIFKECLFLLKIDYKVLWNSLFWMVRIIFHVLV